MEIVKYTEKTGRGGGQGPLHALRFREFRLFWFGQIAQACGMMMFQFTLGWLAFELTGSSAKLALIHLCGFAPQILLTLVGGVLADRWDPRKLIGVAEAVSALVMFTLGMLALFGMAAFWHLALAAFLVGASTSIDEPSRATFFPRLLPDRSHLRAAVPLVSMAWGGTRIVAPSIAGFVIAAAGADVSFLASACGASLLVAIMCLLKPVAAGSPSRGGMRPSMPSRRARRGAAMRPSDWRASPSRSRQSPRSDSSNRSAVVASSPLIVPLRSARASMYARSATTSTGIFGMALTGSRG